MKIYHRYANYQSYDENRSEMISLGQCEEESKDFQDNLSTITKDNNIS
jgi:hypothetical protein